MGVQKEIIYKRIEIMITLKTLDQATEQEVFDQVAKHLLTQKAKSKSGTPKNCVYKSHDGLKCAAGCLIADDEYDIHFEGETWRSLFVNGLIKTDAHLQLIGILQRIHDNREVANWKGELIKLAKEMNLDFKFDDL